MITMNIKKHLSLNVSQSSVHLFRSLPHIDNLSAEKLSNKDLKKLLSHYTRLWCDILQPNFRLLLRSKSRYRTAYFRFSTSTDILLREYLHRSFFRTDDFLVQQVLPLARKAQGLKKDQLRGGLQSAFLYYWVVINFILIGDLFNKDFRYNPVSMHAESVIWNILALMSNEVRVSKTKDEKLIISSLLTGLLQILADVFDASIKINTDHTSGFFSELKPEQFTALANRNEYAIRKFGEKKVEKVFERQLTLCFQSLGFYVIPSKTGTNAVDLLCISPDPRFYYTFMLEAKTSGRPYALPKKDQRALQEYVTIVTQDLGTLPPPKFMLIVGPSPASTLKEKIAHLQNRIELPVRYITASTLSDFRERLSVYLSHGVFMKGILSGEFILSDTIFTKILQMCISDQKTHQDFIQSLLKR